MKPFNLRWGQILLTMAMLACAALLGWHVWDYYMYAPWTRDGKVSADVVQIAPEVSGTVLKVNVADNQFVHRGEILYQIDPERFQLALQEAEATLDSKSFSMNLKKSMANRRTLLGTASESRETIEQAASDAKVALADFQSAQTEVNIARLNLEKTTVRAPADGYVTNLSLRTGDFATSGVTSVSILETDSFRVIGYFQETQLGRIKVGDKVKIKLMGSNRQLAGHVESFGRGISDSNTAADHLGLPNVEPVFNWVRLAQRIPVRIKIDNIPPETRLSSGMTAGVSVIYQ
ncbi:membrane protein [Kosakonia radicincitans UMEnt01/12]|uniref:efflux RND transporter periplasmic adaptor subunit n=1 Tax=Kosakonia radicincitans TaxID=283686 RepID=UPI0004612C8A|nr:efflux RND transporter periplasmic adaptor subunit [Kosakonia radicincitans]KDE34924.1 membrane protein [Kosakonia radicincitans UMEnt01/12]